MANGLDRDAQGPQVNTALGIARTTRRVRTSTFSIACGWMPVERSVPASEQLLRLAFGKPHLRHVLTGLERFSVLSHSG